MKRVAIIGKNSYVGNNFFNYTIDKIQADIIDTMSDEWKTADLSQYDSVYFVAGIVHVKKADSELYYRVNHKMALEVAQRAKAEGVKQFIYMSTMKVYGMENGLVNKSTIPTPRDDYGKSKLMAEEGLNILADDNFKVAIIRPPMIYGKGTKGNFPRLLHLSDNLFFFPDYNNSRSMLYIDNLCELLYKIVENSLDGIFYTQNNEYVKTSDIIATYKNIKGEKCNFTRLFNPFIKLFMFIPSVKKIFGTLIYDKELSMFHLQYNVVDFKESIIKYLK